MIVFPNGYTLGAVTPSLKNSRIGYQTWTRGALAADVTVSSETEQGPKDAPLRPTTYEFWQADALPATWEIDFGTGRDIDYVGVVGTVGSAGASITIETQDGTTTGSPPELVWTLFASDALPGDDSPLMFIDDERTVSGIRITLESTGSIIPTIAVVYAGKALAMSEPIRGGGHAPMNLRRETVLRQPLSRGGQFLDQSFRRTGEVGSASFEHLASAWYRANFDPFVKEARRYPFFFAWRPEDYPSEVAYAWADGDIRPQYEGVLDWMAVSFAMRGLGHE